MSDQQPENNNLINFIAATVEAMLNKIETELSRLRSVVYLLVKDKPEMLRLLGQSPPPPSEEGRT